MTYLLFIYFKNTRAIFHSAKQFYASTTTHENDDSRLNERPGITKTSSTLIDNRFCNEVNEEAKSGNLTISLSDHLAQL